jgi:hypothetical protein
MNQKIVIAGSEIANNIHSFGDALRSNFEVTTVCFHLNKYYKSNRYDYNLSPIAKSNFIGIRLLTHFIAAIRRIIIFPILLYKNDIFIYIWTNTFLPFKIDLFLLNILKKKVIVFHCGDDVRYRPIQIKFDSELFNLRYFDPGDLKAISLYESSGNSFIRSFYNQVITEKSGSIIVSMRSHATFQKRANYFFRFPQKKVLDAHRYPSIKPLIIHAPSNRIAKNTQCVLSAIEFLKDEGYEFEFRLLEGQSNQVILSQLQNADILIDQPGPWPGRLGVEALASSCILISGNRPDYYGIKDNSPVVQFDSNYKDLAEKLKSLIIDYDERAKLMRESFTYWERYYSEESFSQFINDLLLNRAKPCLPIVNHREFLIRYANNFFQRIAIKIFY